MKKLLLAVFILSAIGIGWWTTGEQRYTARDNPSHWGEKIRLGTQFLSTDSLELRDYFVNDSLYTGLQDTLFSDALTNSGQESEGIYRVTYFLQALGDGVNISDSCDIDVRLGEAFYYFDSNNRRQQIIKWDFWKNVLTMQTDTLAGLSISESDSSWWHAAYLRQYRVIKRDADVDTSQIILTDYLR